MRDDTFAIGHHRPVYLWGGPGTVRMNRLKFMDAPVDEAVHAEAHTEVGAQRMAEAGFSWAYLMYNWGFPPEIEREDYKEFRRAVEIYQTAGMKVFGYVQASNCVYDGSYLEKDWYAVDPRGHRYHYYTGRYMACWTHPGWLEHLRGIVQGIIEAGADGVFYDNPWHGIQPMGFGGAWMGGAGCYCSRCQAAYRQDSGLEMPAEISPERDPLSRTYLNWRAGQVTSTLAMLSDYARSLNPEIVIGANDFDAVMRPSYLIFGIDLAQLARVQDVIVIEDYGLPRWTTEGQGKRPVLVNNASTLHTAQALIGDTPLSTIPYDRGIGFDGVYSPSRFRKGIAEAAACGATMVVKGTEYVEDGTFTLLTAEKFAPQRRAAGQIHGWLAEHADLYQGRTNAATVALLHPGDALWQDWERLAPIYFGVGQTLLEENIPWQVVTGNDLSGLDLLLTLTQLPAEAKRPPGLTVIHVPDLAGWSIGGHSFLARHKSIRSLTSRVVGWLFQSYFRHRLTRKLVDGVGLVHYVWQTPFFRLPSPAARATLQQAMGERPYPRVVAELPVLATVWRKGGRQQLHLVNYATTAQRVQVEFGQKVEGRLLSADPKRKVSAAGQEQEWQGRELTFELDEYVVLEYEATPD